VFRNGLDAALRLFAGSSSAVLVLTQHTMLHADDEIAVTSSSDMLSVRLLDPRNYFFSIATPVPGTPLFDEYQVTTSGRTSCAFHLRHLKSSYALRYYSHGALHPLK